MKPLLLCTDLDRTLVPNGTQEESAGCRELLAKLAARREVSLAYVSGRHLELIEQAIEEFDLPVPDFAIADVGASIYRTGAAGWKRWTAWDARISQDWKGASHADLCLVLKDLTTLVLQEPEKQGRHKLSFYTPLVVDASQLTKPVQARLKVAGLRTHLVWSVDEATGRGLLDILPERVSKLKAIEFVMQARGYLRSQTVFAGDSGNDVDVLLSGIPAVLVANADEGLRATLAHAEGETLYFAKGGYLGMNGHYSAGILEGLSHFRGDVAQWLGDHLQTAGRMPT